MDKIEKRLDELEIRLQKLEYEIRVMHNEKRKELLRNSPNLIVENKKSAHKLMLQTYSKPEINVQEKSDKPAELNKSHAENDSLNKGEQVPTFFNKIKDNESLVGKYIIGALASLLIFIAAVSFVAIVWNKISPEIKLAIVGIIGFTLTSVGFNMTIKKASNISSIIFGTGIGLVYIAILSANLVFYIISNEASALFCVFWTLIILFSYRYTKLYFTMIIAAIGSFVNLCFEANYVKSLQDIILIIAYTSVVTIMLMYMSNNLDKIRNAISIFFAFCNFVFIFFMTFQYYDLPHYALIQAVVAIIIILISNWMYRLSNRENMYYIYLFFAVFSTLFVFYNIYYSLENRFKFTPLQSSAIFFAVILVQFIINHIMYPNIEKPLTMFYILPLYAAMINISHNPLAFPDMGAAIIILLLILRKKIFKKPILVPYMMVLVFFDFGLSHGQNTFWILLLTAINLLLLFYILYEEKIEDILYKNVVVAMLLFGYFRMSGNICSIMKWNTDNNDIQNFIAYLLAVITVIFVYKIGYLNNKDEKCLHVHPHLGLYIFSTLLYSFGMWEMIDMQSVLLCFIVMIAALIISLFQTRLLLLDYEEIPTHIGVWLVTKYLIFSWVALRAFWELPLDSVLYSVVGLLLAIGAIYAGFKREVKSIRQFGLGITMLMVAKFILVDLQVENSITRVIAFAIGGVLCFIISIIYNRLSKE